MITVTEVRLYGTARGRLIAMASIVLNGGFAVRGIRVVKSFDPAVPPVVLMPSRAREDGTQAEHCHPIRRDARLAIESAILARIKERDAAAVGR